MRRKKRERWELVDLFSNYRDAFGNTLLHVAAAENRLADVEKFLGGFYRRKRKVNGEYRLDETRRSIRVDAMNGVRETPLYACAYGDSVEIARLLVKNGANANARNSLGFTPAVQCVYSKAYKTLEFLIDFTDPFATDKYKLTLFHHAHLSNDETVLEIVIEGFAKRGVWARLYKDVDHFDPDFLKVFNYKRFVADAMKRDENVFKGLVC